ncbi:MAG: TetR family transcriptional regulator [Gemmatimonadales bacterium]|nr:TetR family transcriptional regulator [Gemmatimonadales bacterium]NIN13557.1 TetR family transcriptional regulator [Gemmatimonadales bacterium]NIR01108.1 TetR family transcriptional regulator [Gemmatimonadales bacterium]
MERASIQPDGSSGASAATSDAHSAKQRRFFEAAEPLFERFGFRKTTVEDVCRAAGMSKRTFYELFRDKQDLLLQLVEAVINDATETWEASLPDGLDPVGRLHSFLDLYAHFAKEHPFLQVLVEDLDLMRSFGARTEEIRLSQMGGPLDRILRDGMAAGQFRRLDPRAAMWVVFGILDTVYLLMPRVMNAPGPLEDPVLAEEMKQFVVRGLGAIEETSDD